MMRNTVSEKPKLCRSSVPSVYSINYKRKKNKNTITHRTSCPCKAVEVYATGKIRKRDQAHYTAVEPVPHLGTGIQ
eukprot:scaffold9007_cov56-Phaeocystis_antarctica.AAC.2